MKLQILIPMLALLAIGNGCRSTSDTQAQHRRQTSVPVVDERISGRWAEFPICLSANDLSIATGQPSLVPMSSGGTHIPVCARSTPQ